MHFYDGQKIIAVRITPQSLQQVFWLVEYGNAYETEIRQEQPKDDWRKQEDSISLVMGSQHTTSGYRMYLTGGDWLIFEKLTGKFRGAEDGYFQRFQSRS